jgi:hypothetical protein
MQLRSLATILAGSAILACCARWEPTHRPGPVTFDHVCPLRRAPRVAAFGEAGVRAVYHFAVQDAPEAALNEFVRASQVRGFRVAPVMVNLNGTDTLVIWGRAVLHDQRAVDREFRDICRLSAGRVYLTQVRHNPPGRPEENRVR